MNIFERFGSIAAAGRGSRPRIPKKVRTLFSAAAGIPVNEAGANPAGRQDSHQPTAAASLDAGDQSV